MDSREINQTLLKMQIAWRKALVESDDTKKKLNSNKNEDKRYNRLSFPFYFGVSQEYVDSYNKNRIMIIGQETGGGFDFFNSENEAIKRENEPEISQRWTIQYNEKQIGNNNRERNNSPFWGFTRAINAIPNSITCYNNVDKIHFSRANEAKSFVEPIPLSYQAESIFSSRYLIENEELPLPLLRREINLLHEESMLDYVIFVTGPYYAMSMELALGIEEHALGCKPSLHDPIVDITNKVGIEGIHFFWTYHPNYLRQKRKEADVIARLANHIQQVK